jgi:hypothetical protein
MASGFLERYKGNVVTNADSLTLFGKGAAVFKGSGNFKPQLSVPGISPGATGADNVLAVYTIPAGSFDTAGRGISIVAQGSFAANGNTKQVRIIVNPASAVVGSTVGAGGTVVADTGPVTTNGGGWCLAAAVYKYGANGSNTQIGYHQQSQTGATIGALLAPSPIAANESAPILVAITGNATTTATDILLQSLSVGASN